MQWLCGDGNKQFVTSRKSENISFRQLKKRLSISIQPLVCDYTEAVINRFRF